MTFFKSTINKKKLWYFMRINTINRQMNEMIEKINLIKNTQSFPLKEQINTFISKINGIKYGVSFIINLTIKIIFIKQYNFLKRRTLPMTMKNY